MKNIFYDFILKTILPAMAVSAMVIFTIVPVGCKEISEGLEMLEGDFESPKIMDVRVISENEVEIQFSKNVKVSDVSMIKERDENEMDPSLVIMDFTYELHGTESDDEETECNILSICTKENMIIGQKYEIYGNCKDFSGNSLTFSIPVLGYNSCVPELVISEVRNAYGQSTVGGIKYRRGEYIELYALSDGNLSGVKIESAVDKEKSSFVLPSVNVKKGEYIVVHMRRFKEENLLNGEKMISELGDDLNLSSTYDSSSARDIWSVKENNCFAISDVVVLENTANGKILDAIVYASSDKKGWTNDCDLMFAKVKSDECWKGEPLCVDSYTSTSLNRCISRQNISDLANGKRKVSSQEDFWVVKKVTPGFENNNQTVMEKN